ncbi:hypothetical protein [Paenibacillus thiaminolyticus]|uniref:Uncharacterized protein n=1 Tax=Paenibacillus thiaminolyticus TaxID=49283 RepID=A0A3A3GN01_PANTH|nr:hypothetical protein [Paenibacillus thiaminolyticus]RJG24339.1 hypothetical protein DQX05_10825 [Paenibacillus thiaminolyticus]
MTGMRKRSGTAALMLLIALLPSASRARLCTDPFPERGSAVCENAEAVSAIPGAVQVVADSYEGAALLYGWGSNRAHQISAESAEQDVTPRLIGRYNGVKKLRPGKTSRCCS